MKISEIHESFGHLLLSRAVLTDSPGRGAGFASHRIRVCVLLLVFTGVVAGAGTATAGWLAGDVISYTQVSWADNAAGSKLLTDNYASVYASRSDVLTVGSAGGFSLSFGDAAHVLAFLPQAGVAAALSQSQTNPGSSESGLFGGDAVGLQLDVDFSDAGLLVGTSGLHFGDLILTNFTNKTDFGSGPLPLAILNGLTVRDFLADANTALGGGSRLGGLPVGDLDLIAEEVAIAFDGGTIVTEFAQDHLAAPQLAAPAPEPATWMLLCSGLFGAASFGFFKGRKRPCSRRPR